MSSEPESRLSVEHLRSGHPRHEEALGQLHGALLRVAKDELSRRRGQLGSIGRVEYDDLAQQAADGALMSILGKLDEFRGGSRFTSWVSKFVIAQVAGKVALYVWRRQPPSPDQLAWDGLPDWLSPRPGERTEQLEVLSSAIGELSDREREVFVAVALNEVSMDVLALQLDSSRGAMYKSLFEARRTLRNDLAAAGHAVGEDSASA